MPHLSSPRVRPFTTIAAVGLATVLGLAGCSRNDPPMRNTAGVVVRPGSWSVFDLRPGDCLNPKPDIKGDVATLPLVPCSTPHPQEVFGTVKNPADAFPGAEALTDFAQAKCVASLQTNLGLTPADGYFVSYILPSFDSWTKKNDRNVVCVLVFPTEADHVGSVVADRLAVMPSTTTTPATTTSP